MFMYVIVSRGGKQRLFQRRHRNVHYYLWMSFAPGKRVGFGIRARTELWRSYVVEIALLTGTAIRASLDEDMLLLHVCGH